MAFKRQYNMMAAFSMASMTDVIFLLLIFFMVTSTFVLPTGMEVNLPSSNRQSSNKPAVKVYLDSELHLSAIYGDNPVDTIAEGNLSAWLMNIKLTDPQVSMALYADKEVPYGKIIDILNIAADQDVNMVLATQPISTSKAQMSEQPQESNVAPADR